MNPVRFIWYLSNRETTLKYPRNRIVRFPKTKVKNLYRIAWHNPEGHNHIKEKRPVGWEKAPNWEKISFQLEKFFFPVRNPVFGGYWLFYAKPSIFPFQSIRKTVKDKIKRFYKRLPFLWESIAMGKTVLCLSQIKAFQYQTRCVMTGTAVPANWYWGFGLLVL